MRSAAAVRSKKGDPCRKRRSFRRMDLIGVFGATSAKKTQYGCASDRKRYSASARQLIRQNGFSKALTKLFEMISDPVICQLLFRLDEQVFEQLMVQLLVWTLLAYNDMFEVSFRRFSTMFPELFNQSSIVEFHASFASLIHEDLFVSVAPAKFSRNSPKEPCRHHGALAIERILARYQDC